MIARFQRWRRQLIERALVRLSYLLPRQLVYSCAVRILNEVTNRPELSHIGRQLHQGELRMLHVLELWINARETR